MEESVMEIYKGLNPFIKDLLLVILVAAFVATSVIVKFSLDPKVKEFNKGITTLTEKLQELSTTLTNNIQQLSTASVKTNIRQNYHSESLKKVASKVDSLEGRINQVETSIAVLKKEV